MCQLTEHLSDCIIGDRLAVRSSMLISFSRFTVVHSNKCKSHFRCMFHIGNFREHKRELASYVSSCVGNPTHALNIQDVKA